MFAVIYSISVILFCLMCGYGINHLIGGLPASLYGMLILTATLLLKFFDPEKLKTSVQFMIKHMGVCFVPAGVGVMQYSDLLARYGIAMALIIIATTLFVIVCVGVMFQYSESKKQ